MTIDLAIKQLEILKQLHGNAQLKMLVQTGPDSWEYKKVTGIGPTHAGHFMLVTYKE